MRGFPVFLLLYGISLITACQSAQGNGDLPIVAATEIASPTPTEPPATVSKVEVTPTNSADELLPSPISPTTTSPLADETPPIPTEVMVTPNALLAVRGDSFSPSVSADGRYVVFASRSGDLVDGDTNRCRGPDDAIYNCSDIFLADRQSEGLKLISIAPNGQSANGNSFAPAVSNDGRWVAFVSEATNLTEKPIGFQGVFLLDVQNGRLELIAPSSGRPSISADGRFVTYSSGLSPQIVYLYDHDTGRSNIVSRGWDEQVADGDSITPQISTNGRWVAFWSWAGNLIPDDSEICRENESVNYSCGDVHIFDQETSQIERIPVGEGYGLGMGDYSLSLSADGNRLAFNCQIYERETTFQLIYNKRCGQLSENGQFAAFQQGADFFVQELATGSVMQVSIASNGTLSNGELINFETTFEGERFNPGFDVSENARWVVFATTASNLDTGDTHICEDPFFALHNCYDIYIHDRETGLTEWISKQMMITDSGSRMNTFTPTATTEPPSSAPTPVVQLGPIEWVSRAADGVPGNGSSESPILSADGRFVAFVSRAGNLVPDDSESDCIDMAYDPPQFSCSDLFVYDRQTGMMERVSVADDGLPGNAESGVHYEAGSLSSISGDGRFVTFQSFASNLVPGCSGIYVHDRQTGQTTCAAVASNGTPGNNASSWPVISADGRFVVFVSEATNLVPDDTNGFNDYFVHDLQTGQTDRVSVASDGTEADNLNSELVGIADLSADGRFVAFISFASNLVADDTNGQSDIFVRDRQMSTTERISVAGDGTEANTGSFSAVISADGRFVAFVSQASNLVPDDTNGVNDVFVHDRVTGQTTRVSVAANGSQAQRRDSGNPSISANGRWVGFTSGAANLVPDDTNRVYDVFVHDRQTGQIIRVSVADNGQEANGDSYDPVLSADGCVIAFTSLADNLIPADTNERWDIFVRDLCK